MRIVVVVLCMMLVGCSDIGDAPTNLSASSSGHQFCYDGVTYVRFGQAGSTAWGSVKFNRDGTVATCD